MSSYRPDSERAMEVRLFEGTNNPNPIIDMVEQEMAFRAQGKVHVYLEYERDLSALKKVVKVSVCLFTDGSGQNKCMSRSRTFLHSNKRSR